jgi:hypothetical protein
VTAPTFESCKTCATWQRIDLLGPTCTGCGRSLVNGTVDHPAVVSVTPAADAGEIDSAHPC